MRPTSGLIAIEEHIATEEFLRVAHGLDVASRETTEISLTREYEKSEPLHSALTDLEARIAGMDAIGQQMAVLSINPPGVQPYKSSDAVSLARTVNDSLAASVRAHPDRFGAFGTVAPQDPEAAAVEIERVMGPLGLQGVMINSHTGGHYLDEPRFAPLLAAAESADAPIYLHPRMPSVLGPYDVYGLQAAIWGYQAEAGLHAMRLILSGTFDRYPRLTLILGHLGEGLPYWLRRIDNRHAYATRIPGAAGAMPKLELAPSGYFRRNIVITTSGIDDPQVLDLAISTAGEENVMFAIDTPYENAADAAEFLANAPIDEQQRQLIGRDNAKRVLRL